ncbi:MAG: nitroreductase family protein [Microthrixaceae bacterium]
MTDAIDIACADGLLTTTRSVRRRLDLDRPVSRDLILECIDVALQAPSSARPDESDKMAFFVVTEPALKRGLAELYRAGQRQRIEETSTDQSATPAPANESFQRVMASARHLSERLQDVPAIVIPCVNTDLRAVTHLADQAAWFGSVLPAAWSFMLACRARGLGAAWTTAHLTREREVAELLGIPSSWTQVAMLPVAYYTGSGFKPAARPAASRVTHFDTW